MTTYDQKWFEARAVSSIKRLGEGAWDFSDSLLLYLPQAVQEYESMQETLDLLSDDEALSDLRQSRDDFVAGDTFSVDEVRAELDRRRGKAA